MRNSMRKRILALVLATILAFNGSIAGFASEVIESETAAEAVVAAVSEEATQATVEATEAFIPTVEEIVPATEAETETVVETETESVEETPEETVVETEVETETRVETEAETETEVETETVEETEEETETETETEEETEEEKDITLQTKVKGTVIMMTGPSSSFPEGKDYKISATELTAAQESDVEVALRKMELENETKVVSYQAYDVKLIVDGVEAQPLGEVKVTFEGGAVEEKVDGAEAVEVFHIDEAAQEAQPITNEVIDSTVEMTTDHFSTYVITITTNQDITVTVEHYEGQGADAKQLYRTREYPLTFQTKLEEIAVQTTHYSVSQIVIVEADGDETALYEASGDSTETNILQVLEADAKYRVYYTPNTDSSEIGGVQMFDYQVSVTSSTDDDSDSGSNSGSGGGWYPGFGGGWYPGSGGGSNDSSTTVSINDASNYPDNTASDKRFRVGGHLHNLPSATNANGTNVNKFYDTDTTEGVEGVLNIITGVNMQTGKLYMTGGLEEPGLFTQDEKIGKQVLSGYQLKFSRTGDSYQLKEALFDGKSVLNGTAGADFFPLDHLRDTDGYAQEDKSQEQDHNYYFGMRYDISFKIGEYVGDLLYEFTGDDDLWVVLDAGTSDSQVVVDVGGIHRAIEKDVDLWTVLDPEEDGDLRTKKREKLTAAELDVLEKEHTLTILYMERGAGDSNCSMKFTLPNSRIVDPVINNVDFTLNIEKTISGLTEAEFETLIDKLVFKVTPTNNGVPSNNGYALFNEAVKEISAENLTWTKDLTNQTYTGTYTLKNANSFLNQFEYTVSEEQEDVLGYEVSTSVTPTHESDIKKSAPVVFDGQNIIKTVSFTNTYTPETQDVDVTKVWKDAGNAYGKRPATISFKLKWSNDGGKTFSDYDSDNDGFAEEYTIEKAGQTDKTSNVWTYTVEDLPKHKDGKEIMFQVEEIVVANSDVDKYYDSSSNGTVMTNRFKVEIIKVSSSYTDQSNRIPLTGAEFTLTKNDGSKIYYARSEANGCVVWYSDNSFANAISEFEDGSYVLSEYKAPTGYAKSVENWNIEVIDGVLKLTQGALDNNGYTAYFVNTPLYVLPSSGGLGIYWYMIAGMMMMMVATAITYKNRREEVLERID